MTDLLQPTLASQHFPSRSLSTSYRMSSPDPALLSQTILQWQTAIFTSATPPQAWPIDRFIALHRLVKRIAQVRATGSGEAVTNSSTREFSAALLEQVRPEAQDVLTSLSAIEPIFDHKLEVALERQQSAQSLKTLIPWLLWNLVQTTHEAVQLIEGCAGQVRQGETWQSGTLRLAVGLKLTRDSTIYAFDLVTQQALPQLLAPETQIRMIEDAPESLLLQASTVATALQRLVAQLKTHSALKHYWRGFPANWLIPHHAWQSGMAVLELGFEFIPAPSSLSIQYFNSRDTAILPDVKFSQRAWLEQHISIAVEHQLTQVLNSITPTLNHLPSESDAALSLIVEQGCAAMDELQCSLTLASRTFAQQVLSLDALGLRLIWNISRTAYEVMQFTSGIAVGLLAPQTNWQSGLLRFVVQLGVRTPNQVWQWDLVQRTTASTLVSPPSDAIVQADHVWCIEPVLLGDLETKIWQIIEQAAPEIAMIRTATEAIVTIENTRELGTVQLLTAFEFTPTLD